MKIKLDENVPRRLENLLRACGHDADTVHDEGRVGQPDAEVAQAATRARQMLMTLDLGFPASAALAGNHAGVVVLRLRDESAPAVEALLAHLLVRHDLEDPRGCIVIVSPGRPGEEGSRPANWP